ncbi:MAG: tol-pal system-associated acyl-CoA thioesterase [Acetobacteraceae bacterium]|nr:tol-pal system-associated acyl-CoA thioesterase [Acetobacteraceae bacterium]
MNCNVPSTGCADPHRYTVRVYYEDTDAGGIVYYANYLRFIERARTEALRTLGIPHAQLVAQFSRMFVVRRVEMDYLRPARVDDLLVITTSAEDTGGASLILRQTVRAEDGTQLADARVHIACVAVANGAVRRIPREWLTALQSLRMAHQEQTRSGR